MPEEPVQEPRVLACGSIVEINYATALSVCGWQVSRVDPCSIARVKDNGRDSYKCTELYGVWSTRKVIVSDEEHK
jgi:hypothetical protein